jgi:hypothetical protein
MVTVNLGRVRPIHRGPYDGATAYTPLDIVTEGATSYFCIAPTTGNAPPNASFWSPIVVVGTASAADLGTDPGQVPTNADADTRFLTGKAEQTFTDGEKAQGRTNLGAETQERLCTYGGTANAITLTSGLGLAAIPDGFKVVFRATAANTGTMTANLDGLGAKAVKTVTGANTPAGYIRVAATPDFVTTEMRWSATGDCWIADRQIERGSNANGTFTRWADGTMECIFEVAFASIDTVIGAGFWSGGQTWTFPAAFIAAPVVGGGSGTSPGEWVGAQSSSATAATVALLRFNSAATARGARVKATGSWY